jgi:hypothetical protein
MLGDACVAAGLASIPVDVLLRDGRRVGGMPSPRPASEESDDAVDATGYSSLLIINGDPLELEDIVEFVIRSP